MTVALEGVAKRWSARGPWILHDINLDLPAGLTTVLTGANGSGKSTLLRLAAGLSRPTRGSIHGRPRRIAVVPDRFQPPPRMSSARYLNHFGRMRGVPSAQLARRCAELADQFGLSRDLGTDIDQLSKGNAQKVLLAQAFLCPVELLVLDEPRTALDAGGRAALDGLIDEARAAGSAVLISEPVSSYPGSLQIVDGRLAPIESRSCTVNIELIAPHAGGEVTELEPELVSAVARVAADRVRVTVDAAHSDRLLATALRRGWSVRELRRFEAES